MSRVASTRPWSRPSRPTPSAARTGPRGLDAQRVLLRSLEVRRRRPGPAAWARTTASVPIADDDRRLRQSCAGTHRRWPRRTSRPASGGTTLMALSNSEGHLVLTTGNKSELGRGLLDDLRRRLDRWFLTDSRTCPRRWCSRSGPLAQRPGRAGRRDAADPAELDHQDRRRPNCVRIRRDSDSLPDYDLLDAILALYVDADRGAAEIVAEGYEAGAGATNRADGRRGRVEAAPVPAGHEDQLQGVRPRPPAADHQPVARDRLIRLYADG